MTKQEPTIQELFDKMDESARKITGIKDVCIKCHQEFETDKLFREHTCGPKSQPLPQPPIEDDWIVGLEKVITDSFEDTESRLQDFCQTLIDASYKRGKMEMLEEIIIKAEGYQRKGGVFYLDLLRNFRDSKLNQTHREVQNENM
jgi:hypothetical protein